MGKKPPKPPGLFSSGGERPRYNPDSVIARNNKRVEEKYGPLKGKGDDWESHEDVALLTLLFQEARLHRFFETLRRTEKGIISRWWKIAARSPGADFAPSGPWANHRTGTPWLDADTVLLHRATSEVALDNGADLRYVSGLLGRDPAEVLEKIGSSPTKLAFKGKREYDRAARRWHAETKPPRKSSLLRRK